jgi:hypothetical protein
MVTHQIYDDSDVPSVTLFWYKKDAEQYLIGYANEFALSDVEEDEEPRVFKGVDAALKYLNDSYDGWDLEQKTVNSTGDINLVSE